MLFIFGITIAGLLTGLIIQNHSRRTAERKTGCTSCTCSTGNNNDEHYQYVNEKHIARYGWEMKPFYDPHPFASEGCVYSGELNWCSGMQDELKNYCADVDSQTGYCERCERMSFIMNAPREEVGRYWAYQDSIEQNRQNERAIKNAASSIKKHIWASRLLF